MEITNNTFTQIPNELMEILMSSATNASEKAVLVFIARKIYGFHKKTDQISLTQFENKLGLSRPTIVAVLSRLLQVKLILLVKKGRSKKACNEWQFCLDDYPSKLVKLTQLVKYDKEKLVKYTLHTKESSTKEITSNPSPALDRQKESSPTVHLPNSVRKQYENNNLENLSDNEITKLLFDFATDVTSYSKGGIENG
ncbi:MAG TPA: replication protein [Patescibacteria group bacterium]|nr:replication protein [Patescibacteria group bacterium]